MTDKKKLAFVIIPLTAAVLAIFAFFTPGSSRNNRTRLQPQPLN